MGKVIELTKNLNAVRATLDSFTRRERAAAAAGIEARNALNRRQNERGAAQKALFAAISDPKATPEQRLELADAVEKSLHFLAAAEVEVQRARSEEGTAQVELEKVRKEYALALAALAKVLEEPAPPT